MTTPRGHILHTAAPCRHPRRCLVAAVLNSAKFPGRSICRRVGACFFSQDFPMPPPTIRPARADEYDRIARVWMDSWSSTRLEDASDALLAKLRARIPLEVAKGWSLFVADDNTRIAA